MSIAFLFSCKTFITFYAIKNTSLHSTSIWTLSFYYFVRKMHPKLGLLRTTCFFLMLLHVVNAGELYSERRGRKCLPSLSIYSCPILQSLKPLNKTMKISFSSCLFIVYFLNMLHAQSYTTMSFHIKIHHRTNFL